MNTPLNNARFSRAEAAHYLGVSVAFLACDAVTRRHEVPFYKVGRRCIYLQSDLDNWMRRRAVNPLGQDEA